ncbi:MAG: lipoyl synthase [Spirochaetia bacterium]|jgi:lipoic acid synthetase|nr:lipoyl synthase [Spirochaetia bacterium]
MSSARPAPRKPEWLKIKIQGGENLARVNGLLSRYALNTVCKEANCPNRMECYGSRTATFMILGALCSRDCAFCNVAHGPPQPPDGGEALRVASAAKELGLGYAVITSVTRDDLPDGGAGHFARVIRELKNTLAGIVVEALVPDFQGSGEALETVLGAGVDVLNHNVETVPRLYPAVRPQALYPRSLGLLERAGKTAGGVRTKSGLMVGLGETAEEIREVIRDLKNVGCDFLTIGQYLAPSASHYPVAEYIHPARFEEYRRYALSLGFSGVASGPFVRSSYRAAEMAALH